MDSNLGVPFKEAHARTSANRNRIFTKTRGDGRSGAERIRTEDAPELTIKPKFKLERSATFFTIGSCFARNIEAALTEMGMRCTSSDCLIPGEYYEQPGPARNGALNAYTPNSMLELVNWAQRADRMSVGLLQVGEDEWYDMLLSGLKPLTRAQTNEVRSTVLQAYEQLANADVVVLTLGFVEAWYDNQDQIFVNRSPGGSLKTIKRGDRYSFHLGTPSSVGDTVERIIEDIYRITNGRLG